MVASRQNFRPVFYRITIEGKIRQDWSDWMNGVQISFSTAEDDPQTTLLTVKIADQAALRGLLCRLWDLNLTILSIFRLDENSRAKEGLK